MLKVIDCWNAIYPPLSGGFIGHTITIFEYQWWFGGFGSWFLYSQLDKLLNDYMSFSSFGSFGSFF